MLAVRLQFPTVLGKPCRPAVEGFLSTQSLADSGGIVPVGLLEGVKVLDLSEDIAGSFCSRLLADYGADVLKLEPPQGAALRGMGPFFGDDPHPEKSLFFLVMNLNKKGATVNLETKEGREILKALVPHVDVIVESFKPGYLESIGLGYQVLEELNPGLVMTSITPFGQTGPVQPVPRGRNRQLRHGDDYEHQRRSRDRSR